MSLSVIVPARNEGKNLERALASLLRSLPEGGEAILINDRSTDETGTIARTLARGEDRLLVLDVDRVPEGWLGKTHAMQTGYEASSGDYLLFTDADVVFRPGCLARAAAYCDSEGIDHLVATPLMVTKGFWEKVFVSFFSIVLVSRFRIWRAALPRSRFYAGIGAFNLVRRTAYEKAGTHRAIRKEVVDDLMLGRLVKSSGGRQRVVSGDRCLEVRWHEGLRGLITGLEKNAYAGFDFSLLGAAGGCLGLVLITLVPAALPVLVSSALAGSGSVPAAVSAAGVWLSFALLYRLASEGTGSSWLYFPTFPVGSVLLVWTILRSVAVYYVHGGVRWRGTVYRR